jgi:hypothetical protein
MLDDLLIEWQFYDSKGGLNMKALKYLLRFTLITMLLLVSTACEITNRMPEEMPKDFNFSLTYGSYGKKKIDTFYDLVIKDLVEDGTIEANISLTDEEMRQIYQEMLRMNIMGDLDIEENQNCHSEPPALSEWKVQVNGETKLISFKPFCDETADILKLIELEDFIHGMLIEKEEYKVLPEANGAYE